MPARPVNGAEWVVVRLSQVPEDKRVIVADQLIEAERLTGVAEIQMRMAALYPLQNPALRIPRSKLKFGRVRL